MCFLGTGEKYHGNIDLEEFITTARTIRNNVHVLATDYRHLLKPIVLQQADDQCHCVIPDLWSDKHRKVSYLGLSCSFVNKKYESIHMDLCCAEYDESDKTGKRVFGK